MIFRFNNPELWINGQNANVILLYWIARSHAVIYNDDCYMSLNGTFSGGYSCDKKIGSVNEQNLN